MGLGEVIVLLLPSCIFIRNLFDRETNFPSKQTQYSVLQFFFLPWYSDELLDFIDQMYLCARHEGKKWILINEA